MIGIKRVFALLCKEVLELLAGKAWLVLLAFPLFITFLFAVVYRFGGNRLYQVGYWQRLPANVQVASRSGPVRLVRFPGLAEAKVALTRKKVDGLIRIPELGKDWILLTEGNDRQKTALVTEAVNLAVMQAHTPPETPVVKSLTVGQGSHGRWSAMPLWLIQIILIICLLQTTSAVAEEKADKTLHALLTTPMLWTNYFGAKLIISTLLGTSSIWLTLLLTGCPANYAQVCFAGALGGTVYTAVALLIGLIAPTPFVARATATLIYLISTLPLLVKDLPLAGKDFLHVFPSYLIFRRLEQVLLAGGPPGGAFVGTVLILEAVCFITCAYLLILRKEDI